MLIIIILLFIIIIIIIGYWVIISKMLALRYIGGNFNLNKHAPSFLKFPIRENFINLLLVELKAVSTN